MQILPPTPFSRLLRHAVGYGGSILDSPIHKAKEVMGGRKLDSSVLEILITQQQKLRKRCKSAGMMTLIMGSVSGNFIVMVSSIRKLWQ